jgi:hypothetical protein
MRSLAIIKNVKPNIAKNPGKCYGFKNHCHFYFNPLGYKKGLFGVISKYLYKNSLLWRMCESGYFPALIRTSS